MLGLDRRVGATVAAVGVLALLVPVMNRPAGAAPSAVASSAFAVESATWGDIPTSSSSGQPPTGSLTLTYSVSLDPAPQYFSMYNSGTATLAGSDYTVALSGLAVLPTTSVVLTACEGATWDTTANTCSGTTVTVGTWTSSSSGTAVASSAVPSTAASRLSMQASVTGLLAADTMTVVISTSVNSNSPRQIAAGVTANS